MVGYGGYEMEGLSELRKKVMNEILTSVRTRQATIYYWICPKCGKVVESIYLNQVISLAMSHMEKHELKEVRKSLESSKEVGGGR